MPITGRNQALCEPPFCLSPSYTEPANNLFISNSANHYLLSPPINLTLIQRSGYERGKLLSAVVRIIQSYSKPFARNISIKTADAPASDRDTRDRLDRAV